MKKNELERTLQKIPPQSKPKPGLEQYSTPAWIAADILYIAYAQGNIADKKVVDLGCGNGIFSIGSWLLGARSVLGIDIDPDAIEDARRNAAAAGADIELLTADVTSLTEKFDTADHEPTIWLSTKRRRQTFLGLSNEIGIKGVQPSYGRHLTVLICIHHISGRKDRITKKL